MFWLQLGSYMTAVAPDSLHLVETIVAARIPIVQVVVLITTCTIYGVVAASLLVLSLHVPRECILALIERT